MQKYNYYNWLWLRRMEEKDYQGQNSQNWMLNFVFKPVIDCTIFVIKY